MKTPKSVSKFFSELAKKGSAKKAAAARWAGHEKMTEEEKKKKRQEYYKEYYKRKSKEKKANAITQTGVGTYKIDGSKIPGGIRPGLIIDLAEAKQV